jgi:hypothetical protein
VAASGGVVGKTQLFQDNIHNFAKPILQTGLSNSCYSLMQPVDFMKLSLPKRFSDQLLFLCPPEYLDVL